MRVLDANGTVHTGRNPSTIARRLYGRTAYAVGVEVRTGVVHRWEVYVGHGTTPHTHHERYVADLYPDDET